MPPNYYNTGPKGVQGKPINKSSWGGSNTFDISRWQPDYRQTAAMMMDARNRGMTDNEIKKRFGNMGVNLDQMAGYQVLQDQSNSNTSFTDRTTQGLQDAYSNKNLIDRGSGIFEYANDPAKTEDETSWWGKLGKELGGVKGWIDLGVKGMEAYTGLQQIDLAREQNQMGRDAFSFQKAAWNKDYDARKIAYNTNARDVNAWKAAQTPGGYVMSELVV